MQLNYNIKNINIQDFKINISVNCNIIVSDKIIDDEFIKDVSQNRSDFSGQNNNCDKVGSVEPKSEDEFRDGSGGSGGSVEVEDEEKFNFLYQEIKNQINSEDEKYVYLKKKTMGLNKIYRFLEDYVSAYQLYNCGSYLEFVLNKFDEIEKKKLKRVNSCKLRLCPFCIWRKSLKVYSNARKCYDYLIDNYKDSRFIFVTLTRRNVKVDYNSFEELVNEVTEILKGFRKLTHKSNDKNSKIWNNAFLGFIRNLEITYDKEKFITHEMFMQREDYYIKRGLSEGDLNPNYDTYHVHLHILCHTTYSVYSNNYISFEKLQLMWKEVCNLDYLPSVDIRSFKAKNKETKGRELAEVVKYCVKPNDYITGDIEHDSNVVQALDSALFRRRLISYGGTFREAKKQMKLNDEMDLNKEDLSGEEYIFKYWWDFYKEEYGKAF